MQSTPAKTGAVSRLHLWRSAHASEEPALARVLIREFCRRGGEGVGPLRLQRMCARCSALAPGKKVPCRSARSSGGRRRKSA